MRYVLLGATLLILMSGARASGDRSSGDRASDLASFDAGHENRAGLVFAPDGRLAAWTGWDGAWGEAPSGTRTILLAHRRGDGDDAGWSTPAPAPFTAPGVSDDDPFVSPDGRWLYFVSDRPVGAGAAGGDADLWRWALDGASEPERLAASSAGREWSPVVTADGTLYFASDRSGGPGRGDLWRAAAEADGFAEARPLGAAINAPTGEWNLWVSSAGDELLFEASSRATNVSVPGDLYYSWTDDPDSGAGAGAGDGGGDGNRRWREAVPVRELNTAASELLPRVGPHGATLVFTRAARGGRADLVSVDWAALRRRLRAAPDQPEAASP